VARLLRRAGLTSLDNNTAHYGLGLTLGNAEVRLDELTAAYAIFARGGTRVVPRFIAKLDGTPQPPASALERVVSDRTAVWITDILSDADARAYVFGRGGSLEFPFSVAAKTGTSQSYFDNWVVGYTKDVTVGVWVGNFDRMPLRGSSGVTGAGPIFHAVMLAAVERLNGSLPIGDRRPILDAPADLVRSELCATSGMPAGDACPTRVSEWMPAGANAERCTWHHASDDGLITVLPEAYGEWAQNERLLSARTIVAGRDARMPGRPIQRPDSAPVAEPAGALNARLDTRKPSASDTSATAGDLKIVRPLGGAVFLIDPTLRPEFQTLALNARSSAPGHLEWFVDGSAVGSAEAGTAIRWPLVRGRHDVVVRDGAGRSASTRIEVR
jgi:penicillin-binding protein 1C